MRRRSRNMMAVALLTAALFAPSPMAQAQVFAAVFGSVYATPVVVVVSPGQPSTFVNGDVAPHNVVAFEAARDPATGSWCSNFQVLGLACPLFWSATIGLGQSTPILGLAGAERGVPYTFYCTVHPFMQGTLVVAPGP